MCDTKETVRNLFTAYLQEKGLRKTPERYAVLDEVYSFSGHFAIEALYSSMKAKRYRISRATVYNTIDLLLECRLVTRHHFDSHSFLFEKAFDHTHHDHLICKQCGRVEEFSDERVKELVMQLQEKYGFKAHHHLLYVYGLCKSCLEEVPGDS